MKIDKALALLLTLCLAGSAQAAIHVWTGAASDLFSDSNNWRGGSPAGDAEAELSFPIGAVRADVTNDIAGLTVRTIAISGSGYRIAGEAIALVANAEVIESGIGSSEIAADLLLGGDVTFRIVRGGFQSDTGLTISGAIGGSGAVIKIGHGRLRFSGETANTYGGLTRLLDGSLWLAKTSGVDAIPGDVLVDTTGINGEHGVLTTAADEQIPDTATIHIGQDASFLINGTETVGPMIVERSSKVTAAAGALLILGGSISPRSTGSPFLSADARFYGAVVLRGTQTIASCIGCNDIHFESLGEARPGSGIIVRIDPSIPPGPFDVASSVSTTGGTYRGPTLIESGTAFLTNPFTAVRLRNGTFAGNVASLYAERGIVRATSTGGDLRLTPGVTVPVTLMSPDEPALSAGGVLDLGGATLSVDITPLAFTPGRSYVIVRKNSPGPIAGKFAHVEEGAILNDRFRLSYRSGDDGNDATLTYIGRHVTALQLLATDPATNGSVTLTAQITARDLLALFGKQVTFRDGSTLLGTAALDEGGRATITTQPSPGMHTYTVSFEGNAQYEPSVATVTVSVRHAAAVITSIEPSTIDSGTTALITLRGSGFVRGGEVLIGNTVAEPLSVSATEVRFSWTTTGIGADRTLDVAWRQPEPGLARSNTVALLIKAAPAPLATRLTFEPKAVSGPVVPNGGAAWMSIEMRRGTDGVVRREDHTAITPDANGEGIARWERPDDLPESGLWLMTDMTDGHIESGMRDGVAPLPQPFPQDLFVRDADGRFTRLLWPAATAWKILWVRPGIGAWTLSGRNGDASDEDGIDNGYWLTSTANFVPVGGSPAAPVNGFERGDVFLALRDSLEWLGDRVDDHLLARGPGTITFPLPTEIASERAGVARISLFRIGGWDGTVSVRYTTSDLTARANSHYVPVAGTVTFGPGESLKFIDIPILDDGVWSGDTEFLVTLSDPAGAKLAEPSTRVRIEDDDPPVSFSVTEGDITMNEGDEGERTATFVVSLNRSANAIIDWSANGTGGDVQSGTVLFTPSSPTSQTVTIRFAANRTPQPDRTFNVSFCDRLRANCVQRRVTVLDDDFAELTILDASVSESLDRVTVLIALNVASEKRVEVRYATVAGTATKDVDFTETTGIATLGHTTSVVAISIPIQPDTLVEGDETFTVVLSNAVDARIRRAVATVVIVDDDVESGALPVISAEPVTVSENDSPTIFVRFRLSFPVKHEVRFRAITRSGSAISGEDFVATDEVLTMRPGETDAVLRIPRIDDQVDETPQTFEVVLSEVTGAIAVAPVLVTILDDDPPLDIGPSFSIPDIQIDEGNTARFLVRLNAAVAYPVLLEWWTVDGTATAPLDYRAAVGTLTFEPGETLKAIDIPTVADQVAESTEVFSVVFTNAAGARLTDRDAVARIVDHDQPRPRRRSTGR